MAEDGAAIRRVNLTRAVDEGIRRQYLICRGGGFNPPLVPLNPPSFQVFIDPHWLSQKYIADPPLTPSGFYHKSSSVLRFMQYTYNSGIIMHTQILLRILTHPVHAPFYVRLRTESNSESYWAQTRVFAVNRREIKRYSEISLSSLFSASLFRFSMLSSMLIRKKPKKKSPWTGCL